MSRSRGRRSRQPLYGQPQPYTEPQRNASPVIRGDVIDLGEIGEAGREKVTASFSFYGAKIRVNPNLTEIVIMDFLEQAEKIGAKDPHAMVLVKDFARSTIHPDDFDRFWDLVREHGTDTDGLMRIVWKVLDGVTARPTGRPSDSSDGPTVINNVSPGTSSPLDAAQSRRAAFLEQVRRFEAQGTGMGAAMAAQVVEIAKGQGIDLEADLIREPVPSGSPTG